MGQNVDRATPTQLADLVRLLVERCVGQGGTLDAAGITWTPPRRPFFQSMVLAPPDGHSHSRQTFAIDGLDNLVQILLVA